MLMLPILVVMLYIVVVNCYPFSDGDIRLVGGSSSSEGTVLVFHENKWGSICDYHWDIRDANVACRQLGYPRALQYIHSSRFGRGRRRVWLADVYCRGTESRLSKCYNPGWGRLYRRHERACRGHKHSAGIVCLDIEIPAATTAHPNHNRIDTNYNNIILGDEANNIPIQLRSDVPVAESTRNSTKVVTHKPTATQIKTTTRKLTTTPTTTIPTTTTPTATIPTTKKTTTTKKPTTTSTTIPTTTPRPTTTKPTPTTTTTKPTTPKPTTTQRPIITTTDYAAKLPRLRINRWTMDKEIEMWVLALRSGKYLVAVPGRSPKKMTKDQYINVRREKLTPPTTTAKSYVFISNEVAREVPNDAEKIDDENADDQNNEDETNERSNVVEANSQNAQRSERMKSDDPLVQSTGVVLEQTEEDGNTDTSEENVEIKIEEDKKDDIDKDVDDMLKGKIDEDDLANNSFNVEQQQRARSTVSKQTTKLPTTTKSTTTQKPTTTTTTVKPPTTTKTTEKPTTTPIRNARETTIHDSAANLPTFSLNTWVMDDDVVMWVLKLNNGLYMVSKPGQTPKKVTRDEFISIRRKILQSATTTPDVRSTSRQYNSQSNRHDEMKADDPSIQSGSITLGNGRGVSLGGNVVEGGGTALRSSSNQNYRELGSSRSRTSLESNRRGSNSNSVDTNVHGVSHHHRHRHGNEAGVHRDKKVQIRLSGGRSKLDGRIEILPPGQSDWGVICGDYWTIKEAMVACRHFGVGYAQQASKTSYYGGKYQKKYYSAVRCKGKEATLDKCQWEDHTGLIQCTKSEAVAAIVCSKTLPDLEPSTYMVETTAFLQDRHLYYLQCAMEENCLAKSAYELQKTSSRWRTSTRRLLRFSSVVKNIGTADFKPKSRRSDWEWHACHMHYHSMEVFAHYDIVDTNGNRVAEGLKASFCLEDSACDRGVFPKFDCQRYGEQGISVGCSDNYMADIDCQWIDITDLKPGSFYFKLEVNPNLHVPEISYDNNGMTCKLQYTGYYARITECRLISIL